MIPLMAQLAKIAQFRQALINETKQVKDIEIYQGNVIGNTSIRNTIS